MKMVPVESGMISAVGYDTKAQELEVVFNSGAVWRYAEVSRKLYRELLAADSKGRYMRTFIIGVYPEYRVRRR